VQTENGMIDGPVQVDDVLRLSGMVAGDVAIATRERRRGRLADLH
jgi:hypothetical protein